MHAIETRVSQRFVLKRQRRHVDVARFRALKVCVATRVVQRENYILVMSRFPGPDRESMITIPNLSIGNVENLVFDEKLYIISSVLLDADQN